ncbi:MAG TPA: methyltransferase domain-containing protein [Aggregatilineaceae bacterium]|nr:methyltransferase domain-containing protein [Aggregatilineaceae bacterium]
MINMGGRLARSCLYGEEKMPWNPDQYQQFQTQRATPFQDALALVRWQEGLRVIDLGCGTGELTAQLADRLPGCEVLGVDTAAEMLERAQTYARPGLRFEQQAIEDVSGEWDLVFSHSALQWVVDHRRLIPRLMRHVAAGGQLVAQFPSNHRHPVHLLLAETASEDPFRAAFGDWRWHTPVLPLVDYAELLYISSGSAIEAVEKVYPLVLEVEALVEWMKGTGLIRYLDRLPDDLHEIFVERYREKLRAQWPTDPVFYAFTRILVSAVKEQEEA